MLVGLAVTLVPVVRPSAWVFAAGYGAVVLGAALVDVFVLAALKFAVRVHVPKAVPVGDVCGVEVDITHGRGPAVWSRLLPEVTAPLRARSAAPAALTRGTTTHVLEVDTERRGRGEVQAIWVEAAGPFGLVARVSRTATEDVAVAVVPAVERLRKYALERLGDPLTRAGSRIHQRAGEGSELDALQTYAPGMDLRNVDWKSSARHNALRVWRFRHESHQNVVLCVDTGRLMAVPIDGITRLDHAVHASLLLGEWALRARDLVAVHAYGSAPRLWLPAASGLRHAARIRHAAADLEPETEETNHALGLQSLLARLKRRSMVVVFTDFVDSTTAELMVEYLGQIARKHVVVFVAIDDPELEVNFDRTPETLEIVASSVVAQEMARARHVVLERLRHVGVHVVHGPPGRATLDLLARYIEVKRRGLVG
jgi:uncharacterized protein (DUF58 family)